MRRDDHGDLIDGIARRSLEYVVDAPSGLDPVIDFATPEELLEIFAGAVGLPFADTEVAAATNDVLDAVDLIIKHSVHTSHPRFVNQNFAGPDPVSVVGDWLGAALNTTAATFEAAPVFTLMENAVLDKLGRLAGYVDSGRDDEASRDVRVLPPGLFCPGGSMATLYALQLARHRRQPDLARRGAGPERLELFVSESGHYSAAKAAALLGIGSDAVIKIATTDDGCIVPAALEAAILASAARGATPLAVIGTAGTTVTSAFDDLEQLANICERHQLWFHVDGCYGGSALFSAREAHRLRGVSRSDSFVWNLHKMIGMTQQCTALLVKDPAQLTACFATQADYLFQPDKQHGEYDAGDRTFQCARRVDVLKLWLAWKAHGDDGFAQRIDHAVAMADHTRARIAASGATFVAVVPGSFTNVVFAWVPSELRPLPPVLPTGFDPAVHARLHSIPPAIKARLQAEGTGMIGFQPVHGMNTFRMICINTSLQPSDIDALLDTIDRYGAELTDH